MAGDVARSSAAAGAGTARLFTALWPDDALRATIAAQRDMWQWPASAQRMRDERLHLTLHFLGDVDRMRIEPLQAALRAVPVEPVLLRLDRCVVWDHGVASLQPHVVPAALRRLHAALGAALRANAFPTEIRPYRPHVTLARRAFDAVPPAAPFEIDWRADGFVLVESVAGGGRSRYEIVERYSRTSATGLAPKSARSR